MSEDNEIGFVCIAEISGKNKSKEVKARVDTGASSCSVSYELARELELGPIHKVKLIKSANGKQRRPYVKVKLTVKDKTILVNASLADRSELSYPVLLGRNALKKLGFLINPNKK
ncbi:MAG: hypothetical protein PWQ28_493 [Candidatus Woesearchaeota archaeon]|nr:hypothetical protein [Candidatus Woesearchaeota archaeon]